jgi:uncharacterized membrane protein YphA (DoxX/SURF4 family)
VVAAIILGFIFVTSGTGKLPRQGEFLEIIFYSQLIFPFMVNFVNHWLPWVELALGILLVLGIMNKFMASISAVLIVCFIINNAWMQSRGMGYVSCGCFGVWDRILAGDLSVDGALYMDIGMLVLVLLILLLYPRKFFDIRPWFSRDKKLTGDIGDVRVEES